MNDGTAMHGLTASSRLRHAAERSSARAGRTRVLSTLEYARHSRYSNNRTLPGLVAAQRRNALRCIPWPTVETARSESPQLRRVEGLTWPHRWVRWLRSFEEAEPRIGGLEQRNDHLVPLRDAREPPDGRTAARAVDRLQRRSCCKNCCKRCCKRCCNSAAHRGLTGAINSCE